MDLSQPANPIFSAGGGIVLPRHPATPPANMSPPTKVSSASNGSTVPSNAKAAFFSITNLVNGLRQQQQQENSSENGDHATSKGRHENFKNSFLLLFSFAIRFNVFQMQHMFNWCYCSSAHWMRRFHVKGVLCWGSESSEGIPRISPHFGQIRWQTIELSSGSLGTNDDRWTGSLSSTQFWLEIDYSVFWNILLKCSILQHLASYGYRKIDSISK